MHMPRQGETRRPGRVPLMIAAVLLVAGCATRPDLALNKGADGARESGVETRYGIRVEGLHLSAHGYILDLRYRVLNPEAAAPILDPKRTVQLMDDARGASLGIPQSPVIGGMRQTSRNHVVHTDRDYFILFVNPGRAVRAGDKLNLAVDGVRIAELTVQ